MPQSEKTRKRRFTGSLARRVVLVCAVFLIVPLFLHSFFLYWREVQVTETEIVAFLKAFGAEKGHEIEETIQFDWKVLSLNGAEKTFGIQTIPMPADASKQFVQLDREKQTLIVGREIESGQAHVLVHPLNELLAFLQTPFPMDALFAPHLPHPDEWIESIPIAGTDLVLTLGTSRDRIAELEQTHLMIRIGSFVLLLGIVGGVLVYWLTKKLSGSLLALCHTMERVSEGALSARFTPKALGFEINEIGAMFNDTLDVLLAQQVKAEKERLHREKLAQELKLGHDIQASLLPGDIVLVGGPQVACGCVPATEVGGDFCDVFRLPGGELLLVMADVSGKGVSACLFSLGLRSSLRALAVAENDLATVVGKANDLFLLDAKESGLFATVWMGVVKEGILEYVNLGHLPGLLKRGEKVQELTTGHPAMGLMGLHGVKSGKVKLEKGDELVLYSDGITEAQGGDGKLFGMGRLKELLVKEDGHVPVGALVEKVFEKAQVFSGDLPQHDDMTLLIARW